MAFLGGLALLGAETEAYQSQRAKQFALDEAAADQAASKALGAIGGDLAQLQQLQQVSGGGIPNAQAFPAEQAGAQVRFAQDPGTAARTAAPLTGGLVGGSQAGVTAPGAPAAMAPAQASAFMAPGKGDLFTRQGEPAFGDRYPGAADLAGMAGLSPQAGGGQPAGGGRVVSTTPEAGQPQRVLGAQPQPGVAPPGQQPKPLPSGGGTGAQAAQQHPNFTAGMMDLPTLAGLIKKNNPNLPPEVFAKALQKGATLLAPFAQQQLREAMIQMQYRRLEAIHPGYEQFQEWLANNHDATPEQVGEAFNLFTGKQQLLRQRGEQTSEQIAQRGAQTSEQIAQRGAEQRKTQAAKPSAAGLKEREHQTAVTGLIDEIDTAVKAIDASLAGGAAVTGLGGMGQRLYEFGTGVGEQLGLGTGGKETPASNFETQIRIIQQKLPRIMLGTTRTNKEERSHMDQIVRGLGTMTSPQQAKNALNEVKKILQKETEGGDAQPQLPPGVKSIKVVE